MNKENLDILKVLWRSGTQQSERYRQMLDPEAVILMELEPEDWMIFSKNFAQYIPFFSADFPERIINDWQVFFEDLLEKGETPLKGTETYRRLKDTIRLRLQDFAKNGEMKPHMALFVSFLKLMELPRKRLNGLTKRHLDYYYGNILQMEKQPPVPDELFLIFELAKLPQLKIPAGTAVDGGKDKTGKKLIFKTLSEFFPNQASVMSLKNRLVDGKAKKVRVSQQANSLDGSGLDFPSGKKTWWPFGHVGLTPALKDGCFAFGIAAKSFYLKGGTERYISLEITFKNTFKISVNQFDISKLLKCKITGEKGWIETNPSNSLPVSGFTSTLGDNRLRISFPVAKSEPSITGFQKKIHEEKIETGYPLIWFVLQTGSPKAYDLGVALSNNPVEKIRIKTRVKQIHQPQLESDFGLLNPEKPFQPFTGQPKKGSSLYIQYPEWEMKRLTYIKIKLHWANAPENFREWYFNYRHTGQQQLSKDTYVSQHFIGVSNVNLNIKNLLYQSNALNNALVKGQVQINPQPTNLIVNDERYFKYDVALKDGMAWETFTEEDDLFDPVDNGYVTELELKSDVVNKTVQANHGIRISLKQSFLHELYPRLYALAVSSDQPETPIPNEPYTPLVERVEMEYEADEEFDLSKAGSEKKLNLFLKDDFGHYEERKSLKEGLSHVSNKQVRLFSFPQAGGELFIGLNDLKAGQQLSLLFQVLEGSENPLHSSFSAGDELKWSVLIENHWKELEPRHILSDDTNSLLKAGIIRFNLPTEAFTSSSRFMETGVWLRLRSNRPFDATCQLVNVHSQAVKVKFVDNSNELSHLKTGLPAGTITKMIERMSGVKTIEQPYNSFGGYPKENERNYYIRVSERLRHKNRSVSIWDYEHLILQHFPEIHRVKCLNHTNNQSFMAPGNVLLVVIPDTINKNVFDIFQPMVSTGLLNEITAFLKKRASPAIQIRVVNPAYEVVRLKLKVAFKVGLDEAYYKNKLEEDIIQYLSPWTQHAEEQVSFGTYFQESLLVHYLEKLQYVDFIKEPFFFKNDVHFRKLLMPSSPRHILVSAKTHEIDIIQSTCSVL